MMMRLVERLKQYEQNIVYLNWASSGEYGKINYVGCDFIEFTVLDIDKLEYTDKIMINNQLILSVLVVSADLDRISAEYANSLPAVEGKNPNLN